MRNGQAQGGVGCPPAGGDRTRTLGFRYGTGTHTASRASQPTWEVGGRRAGSWDSQCANGGPNQRVRVVRTYKCV